jgi:hypothetical protein
VVVSTTSCSQTWNVSNLCNFLCSSDSFQVLMRGGERVGTLVSQEQMSKDLMSLLVSSCLSVWSGYVHLLFCPKSFDSKFQVPRLGDGQCESRDPGAVTADCGLLSAADGAACAMQAAQGMRIKRVWVSSTIEKRHCTYLVDRELYYDVALGGWLLSVHAHQHAQVRSRYHNTICNLQVRRSATDMRKQRPNPVSFMRSQLMYAVCAVAERSRCGVVARDRCCDGRACRFTSLLLRVSKKKKKSSAERINKRR